MANRIQVDTELVPGDLARLRRVPPRSECQHLPLGSVNVFDGHVEMELLRSLTSRSRRGSKVVGKLERDAEPAHG